MKSTFYRILSCFIFSKSKRREFRNKHAKKSARNLLNEHLEQLNHIEKKVDLLKEQINTVFHPKDIPAARGLDRTIQLISLEILKDVDRVCRKHNIRYWLDYGTLLGAMRHDGFIPWDDDIDISMTWDDFLRFKEVAASELTTGVACFPPGQWGKVAHKDFAPQTDEEWVLSFRSLATSKIFITLDIFPYHYLKEDWNRETAIDYIRNTCSDKSREYYLQELENGCCFATWAKVHELFNAREEAIISPSPTNYLFFSMRWPWQHQPLSPPRVARTCDIFPLKEIEFEGYRFMTPGQPEMWMWCVYGSYWKTKIFPSHLNLSTADLSEIQKLVEHGKRLKCM